MSFGLINANGFACPEIPPPSIGIPSITIKGSLLAFNEAPPLIRMVLPAPGAPLLLIIDTPATLPAINCSGVVIAPVLKSLAVTVDTEPDKSFFLTEP